MIINIKIKQKILITSLLLASGLQSASNQTDMSPARLTPLAQQNASIIDPNKGTVTLVTMGGVIQASVEVDPNAALVPQLKQKRPELTWWDCKFIHPLEPTILGHGTTLNHIWLDYQWINHILPVHKIPDTITIQIVKEIPEPLIKILKRIFDFDQCRDRENEQKWLDILQKYNLDNLHSEFYKLRIASLPPWHTHGSVLQAWLDGDGQEWREQILNKTPTELIKIWSRELYKTRPEALELIVRVFRLSERFGALSQAQSFEPITSIQKILVFTDPELDKLSSTTTHNNVSIASIADKLLSWMEGLPGLRTIEPMPELLDLELLQGLARHTDALNKYLALFANVQHLDIKYSYIEGDLKAISKGDRYLIQFLNALPIGSTMYQGRRLSGWVRDQVYDLIAMDNTCEEYFTLRNGGPIMLPADKQQIWEQYLTKIAEGTGLVVLPESIHSTNKI